MNLCDKIKDLRQLSGMSQQSLADKLRVKQPTIGAYETGRNEPGVAVLIELAKIFGVSVDYLVGADEITADSKDQELLKKFKELSERDKLVVNKVMTALRDEKEEQRQQSQNA